MIVVHPWGIDDGQGWRTPEPAGVAFQCTPAKNRIVLDHAATVINPFLKAMRGKAAMVAYSLPGREDPIRKKLYRSFRGQPDDQDREQGRRELEAKLASFRYRGAGPAHRRSRSRPRRRRSITSASSPASTPARPTTARGSGSCRSP